MPLFSYFLRAIVLTLLSVQFNLAAQFKKQGKISVNELQDVVTMLWFADADRRNLTLHYQAKLDKENVDKSHDKFFPVDTLTNFHRKSTIEKLLKIFDLYDNQPSPGDLDQNLLRKRTEELLNELMKTKEFMILQQKLKQYGVRSAETVEGFKNLMDEIWFKRYKRKNSGKLGSSAFQHVFVGEIDHRKEEVSGMHNWIRFFVLEQKNLIDYAGFVNGGSYATTIKYRFKGNWKSFGSMFVGTSPEFDMSVFTLCYLLMPGRGRCQFLIGDCTQIRVTSMARTEITNRRTSPNDQTSKQSNKRPKRSIDDDQNPIATVYPEVGRVADKCSFKKANGLSDKTTSKGISSVNLDVFAIVALFSPVLLLFIGR